jgi:hypothetical protein
MDIVKMSLYVNGRAATRKELENNLKTLNDPIRNYAPMRPENDNVFEQYSGQKIVGELAAAVRGQFCKISRC